MINRRAFLGQGAGAAAFMAAPAWAAARTRLDFISNPLADYIHLLFFRAKKPRFAPFEPPGFAQAPQMSELVAVPEAVASAGLKEYSQLAPFIARTFAALPARDMTGAQPKRLCYSDKPPRVEEVQAVVAGGAPFYDAFLDYWRKTVQPAVVDQIDAWRHQDETFKPFDLLAEMHRLPFRSEWLQVVAMPFHPAGSGNYSPAAVYSALFREPDLGWFLGHEGSHLLWSAAVGTDWHRHPQAARVAALAAPHEVDVEEAMCLFMQAELSKACGLSPPDYSIGQKFGPGDTKKLLLALEADWPAYKNDTRRWPTLIDYVLDKAGRLFA